MNLKNILSTIACTAVLAAFSGCTSAPKLNSEFDPEADFTDATTFAIVPFPKEIPNTDPGLILRIAPAAKAAIDSTMTAKGYTMVEDLNQADIAVLVHGKSVPKTNVSGGGFSPSYGAGWYGGYPYGASYGVSTVHVDNYDEGTLIVEVYQVTPGDEKQIWVGWSTGRMKKDTSNQAQRTAEAITNLLGKYPDQGVDASAWAQMGAE